MTAASTSVLASAAQLIAGILVALCLGGCPIYLPVETEDIANIKREILAHPSRINAPSPDGATPLRKAVLNNHPELVVWLLDHGAAPNVQDQRGRTALHEAVFISTGDFRPFSQDALEALLAAGASVNAVDDSGETPLHIAAHMCNVHAITTLLHRQADPSARDLQGRTPLHYVADHVSTKHDDCKRTIHLLVSFGAKANVKNNFGSTPVHRTALTGDIALLEALLTEGANVDAMNAGGETALHIAAAFGQAPFVEAALAHGANVNARDERGYTPLRIALERPAVHARVDGSAGVVDTGGVVAVLRRHGGAER